MQFIISFRAFCSMRMQDYLRGGLENAETNTLLFRECLSSFHCCIGYKQLVNCLNIFTCSICCCLFSNAFLFLNCILKKRKNKMFYEIKKFHFVRLAELFSNLFLFLKYDMRLIKKNNEKIHFFFFAFASSSFL